MISRLMATDLPMLYSQESWDKLLRDVDSSFYGNVDVEESEQEPGSLGNCEFAPMERNSQERERLDDLAKGLAAKGFERLHLVLLRHGIFDILIV